MAEGVAAGSDADPAAGISKPVSALAEWETRILSKFFRNDYEPGVYPVNST